jgi:hypothetical protein
MPYAFKYIPTGVTPAPKDRFNEVDALFKYLLPQLEGKPVPEQLSILKKALTEDAYNRVAGPYADNPQMAGRQLLNAKKNYPEDLTKEYILERTGWGNRPELMGTSSEFEGMLNKTFRPETIQNQEGSVYQQKLNAVGDTGPWFPHYAKDSKDVLGAVTGTSAEAGTRASLALQEPMTSLSEGVYDPRVNNDPYAIDGYVENTSPIASNIEPAPVTATPQVIATPTPTPTPSQGLFSDYSNYGGPQIVQETLKGNYQGYMDDLTAATNTPWENFQARVGEVGDFIGSGLDTLGKYKAGIDAGLGLFGAVNNIYSGYKTRQMADKQFDLMKKSHANSVTAYNNQAEGLNATRKSMGADLRAKLLS